MTPVVLASRSVSRAAILRAAGVAFEAADSGVDEDEAKGALLAGGADPRAVAERLAELKAAKASAGRGGLVIGADQTLELDGELYDKARDCAEARRRLIALRGRSHRLHSAAAVAENGRIVWRATESASLAMRPLTDAFIDAYLARGGAALLGSVGCYPLEGEGAQLFDRIEGDYFAILGLPLLPLLGFLRLKGALAS